MQGLSTDMFCDTHVNHLLSVYHTVKMVDMRQRTRREWSAESECKNLPYMFTNDETAKSVKQCIPICNRCPVLEECLNWALVNKEVGIWAGTNTSQRTRMKDRRQILLKQMEPEPDLMEFVKDSSVEKPSGDDSLQKKIPSNPLASVVQLPLRSKAEIHNRLKSLSDDLDALLLA